jgi:hypothetical protein
VEDGSKVVSDCIHQLRATKVDAAITDLGYYTRFQKKVDEAKRKLVDFLGAPGKAKDPHPGQIG